MPRKWTQNSAKTYLSNYTNLEAHGKTLIVAGGTRGLKACSAADYLSNYCGYRVLFTPRPKRQSLNENWLVEKPAFICQYGGVGRRARMRVQCPITGVWVRVPLLTPNLNF